MTVRTPEPVQVVKQRRDDALAAIVAAIPYIQFLNVSFERRGDELTAVMAYRDTLIGNPALPALHGGAIAAFLEVAAVIELTWATAWARLIICVRACRGMPMRALRSIDQVVDMHPSMSRLGRTTVTACSPKGLDIF